MADSTTRGRALLEVVDQHWRDHVASLGTAFKDAIHGLEELLRADDYHHHAQDPDQLERSLGPLGGSNLDVGALSSMLGKSSHSRAMPSDRLARVQALIADLVHLQEDLPSTLADATFVDIELGTAEIVSRAEAHLERASGVFRTLRRAQMEVRSKYEADTHDALFDSFTWRELAPNELRHCPPFVVVAVVEEGSRATLREVVALLERNLPITVMTLRSGLHETHQAVTETGVPATLSVEMLPVAMRGVHFAQTCSCVDGFADQLFGALAAPRPSVLSLLTAREGEGGDAFKRRAEAAVRARGFPILTYDPGRSDRFVDCFDLASNPAPESTWTIETLRGSDSSGHPVEVEEAFTFAHFAADEPEFVADFSDPPDESDDLVPIAEYLDLDRQQRAGKTPCIWHKGRDGVVLRKAVSSSVTLQCAERRHLWRTLREVGGLDNPQVEAARASLAQELSARQQASAEQQRAALDQLRRELEATMAEREQAAIATAVRNLVTKLATTPPD